MNICYSGTPFYLASAVCTAFCAASTAGRTIIFLWSMAFTVRDPKKEPALTREEVESLRKLLSYSVSGEEIESMRQLIRVNKLSNTVNELIIDVKKLEESIENVQNAVHSHITPYIKKTIFNEYKNELKKHSDRLLTLQNEVAKPTAEDNLKTANTHEESKMADSPYDWLILPNTVAKSPYLAPRTPSPCLEVEALSKVRSDILLNSEILEDSICADGLCVDSVEKN